MLRYRQTLRQPFEFQRKGPIARPPGGHKPDFNFTNPSQTSSSQQTLKSTKPATIPIDTLFLVDTLGTAHFENIREIDASSKRLNAIDLSALAQLTNIEKADFSDNTLPLEPFAIMPKLQELDLSCNSLKSFDYKSSETMSGDERAWPSLLVLNLSFNSCGKSIQDLQMIPHLTTLNLSHNGLTTLPANLMHFTCLTTLDLTGNMLNSEQTFFALATIQSLQTLILDKNEIFRIPKFNFGFEALAHISLKNNKIDDIEDIKNLADLELLEDIALTGNPILLHPKVMAVTYQFFANANIELKTQEEVYTVQKRSIPITQMRTIPLDPLTLPTFTKQHQRALNRAIITPVSSTKGKEAEESLGDQLQNIMPTTSVAPIDDVFMTAFGSKSEEPPPISLGETSDQGSTTEEAMPQVITSIWNEVPVVQNDKRKKLSERTRTEFITTFKKLEFLVAHPDLRLKPRESPSSQEEIQTETVEEQPLIATRPPPPSILPKRRKKEVAAKLAARTEYTKTEVQQMLQSMSDRLSIVERDLHATDESGQNAVDIAIDQKNFADLHKKYEVIRAELINTLNS